MKHILIVGASGLLGRTACEFYIGKGFLVTAFVRNPEKVSDLAAKGVKTIRGNLTDPATIIPALQNVDIVLTAAHALTGRGSNSSELVDLQGHLSLIDAAKKSGVGHFIYTSIEMASPNAPLDFIRTKYAVEQYLAESGLTYTIIRPSAFMEWHAWRFLGQKIVETGKTIIPGNGKAKINPVAIHDVVAATDKIIQFDIYRNQILEISGPGLLSRNEIAEKFAAALGKPCKINHIPVAMLRIMYYLFKPFHPGIARVLEFAIVTENKDSGADPANSVARFGLQPTTLDDFIKKVIKIT